LDPKSRRRPWWNTRRLKKWRQEADAVRAHNPELGEDYAEEEEEEKDVRGRIFILAQHEGVPINPALAALGVSTPNGASSIDEDDDIYEENSKGLPQDRDPVMPKYVVPEGGVIRNSQHAYEFTEAISYDYPDPNAA
jgi:hypothetical protein